LVDDKGKRMKDFTVYKDLVRFITYFIIFIVDDILPFAS